MKGREREREKSWKVLRPRRELPPFSIFKSTPLFMASPDIPNNNVFQNLKNSFISNAHSFAEQITPVLTVSKFAEKGVLTPEEFVEAGDQLVLKCPSWSWSGGVKEKQRAFLPSNKQFLITKGVPCYRRVRAMFGDKVDEEDVGDGWTATGANLTHNNNNPFLEGPLAKYKRNAEYEDLDDDDPDDDEEEEEIVSAVAKTTGEEGIKNNNVDDDEEEEEEDYIDLDSFVEDDVIPPPPAPAAKKKPSTATEKKSAILKTRRYDLTITYDKYYQSPRMWLFGFDEEGRALAPAAVFEDVSQDYANKTATIEAHPHLNLQCASIHPCRHADIMKKIVDSVTPEGGKPRVDQAIFIFLKFLQSVLPTIDFDFTMEVALMNSSSTTRV